MLGTVNKLTMV